MSIFEKICQQSHLFKYFWMTIKGLYICVTWARNFLIVFHWTQRLYPLKHKASYLLKIPWLKNLWDSIRNTWVLHCIICLFQERLLLLLLLTSEKGLRDWESLVVKQSEHKGRVVPVWIRLCKRILQRESKISSGVLEDWT